MQTIDLDIKRRIEKNPDKKYLVIYVLAGHGMITAGKQVMLMNEYNDKTGFYKFYGVEAMVRTNSQRFPNSYSICLFACCRELMNP